MTGVHSKRAALVGYPTLDYVVATSTPLRGHGTVPARLLTDSDWPRPGGAVLYAGARLAAAGHQAFPLVSLGVDAAGETFVAACHSAGVQTGGIERPAGTRSPSCVLVHHDSGGYSCLLDIGTATAGTFTSSQVSLASSADLIVISAGPPRAAASVLDRLQPHQALAWIVKDDPACFPHALCDRLSQRADFVFHNRSERALISPGRTLPSGQIRVETRGSEGAVVHSIQGVTSLPMDAVVTADATGAGDTLAGEFLARWLSGERDPVRAALAGMNAARDLVAARALKP